ncbi:MAG: biotin--[acetyl-CoA-carboxylase] ligase [Verrucomicrobiota bacterium]|nr:biotin--[acetyl-CoA-carboxylase] ligase [Verrucomicrobiota bacterium]
MEIEPAGIFREIIVLEKTASTNDFARELAGAGAASGLAVFAEQQSAGRGRFGRQWDSASGLGLWFSLVLRPEMPRELWTRLPTWAAVGVAGVLAENGFEPAIKWPNDIFVCEKKVAGILVESAEDRDGKPFAIIGVGLNVNHEQFDGDLARTATSLRICGGRVVDRQQLAQSLLKNLSELYPALAENFDWLLREAELRSNLIGRPIKTSVDGSVLDGVAEALDSDGALLLRATDGRLVRLCSGEVTILPF